MEEQITDQNFQIIPVEIKGVDLRIDFRLNTTKGAEQFQKQMDILAKLRQAFGDNCLLDELTQLIYGTVEKITVVGYSDNKYAREKSQKEGLLTEFQHSGMYVVQTPNTPISGYQLKDVDPRCIPGILENPEKRNCCHPQDIPMFQKYYNLWLQYQTNKDVDVVPF